jgi:S-adenosylmethionine:tRNA ribosyltransferase-isomerase
MSDVYTKSAYAFNLPDALIATRPIKPAGDARLLGLNRANHTIEHSTFSALPDFLSSGDLCIFNDTKVMPARLILNKPTGGRVELLIIECIDQQHARAWYRSNHPLKSGTELRLNEQSLIQVDAVSGKCVDLSLPLSNTWDKVMQIYGQMPIPPYFKRAADEHDYLDYQTHFAAHTGSVAAPTAGLHFDEEAFSALAKKGIQCAFITLHVGIGTFQPVRTDDIRHHVMHQEHYILSELLCDLWNKTRAKGGRVIAVGSTTVRTLETAFSRHGTLKPHAGCSDLFIYPGYQFNAIDGVITNFHLPESSLMMMMSAFTGRDYLLRAYQMAIAQRYRFFTYGDGMLIL